MAAPSPALSNNSSDGGHNIASMHRTDTPPKTLRGLNKPKCIQCGNVARSRCPYQSCKSCCSKAQNPCHIHVLKANATFPDKAPTPNTPLFDQHSTEVSPAVSSLRAASLRQLSTNFSQFNNLHTARSRKPLTRKEAAAINEWRFSKLNECKERNIEVENEAFDRYMQNVSLLKEVFSTNSTLEGSTDHVSSAEDNTEKVNIEEEKLKIKLSGRRRSENFRKRIQQIVEVGLNKLQKRESDDNVNNKLERDERPEKVKSERTSALSELIDKLSKARNEEDLISCMEMKSQIYGRHSETEKETKDVGVSDLVVKPRKELDYLLVRTVEIDQQDLNRIGSHFSSLRKVTNL